MATYRKQIHFVSVNNSASSPTDSIWNQHAVDGYYKRYMSPDGDRLVWTKRPGLVKVADLNPALSDFDASGPVDGLYFWERQNIVVTVDNGRVRYIDRDFDLVNSWSGTKLMSRKKPYFVDVLGTKLYIANGSKIGEFTPPESGSAASFSFLSDGDAPTSVGSIAVLDQYLVALRTDSERFDWADAGTPGTWEGEYSSAISQPDYSKVIIAANNYLHIFGSNSYEPWYNNGSTFIPQKSGVISKGIGAKDSAVLIDGDIYFIDNTRRFSRIRNFQFETLANEALTRHLQSFSTASTAWGMHLPYDGKNFYVVTFPDMDETIVYDIDLGQFYRWSFFDETTGVRKAWLGNCAAYAYTWNQVFVGDRTNGFVYTLGGETDNGSAIHSTIRTGRIDHGYPGVKKFSVGLTAVFSYAGTPDTPKTISIRWRDDGKTEWSNPIEIECEKQGSSHFIYEIKRLGCYHDRVWEVNVPGNTTASLESLVEEFSLGR